MNLETLTREINNITKIFEGGNESAAFEVMRIMNSEPTLLTDVKLDNLQKNEAFVEALDGLSKFEDKIKANADAKISSFVTRIYNLGENARKTLKPRSEYK